MSEDQLAKAHQDAIRFRNEAAYKRQEALNYAQQAMNAERLLRGQMQKLPFLQMYVRNLDAVSAGLKPDLKKNLADGRRKLKILLTALTHLQQKFTRFNALQAQAANDARKLQQQATAKQALFQELHKQKAALRQSRVVTTTSNEVQATAKQALFQELHKQKAALRQSRVMTTTSNEVQPTAESDRGTKRRRAPPSPERESSPQPPKSKKPRVSSGAPPAPDRKSSSNDPEPAAATSSQPSGIGAWLPRSGFASDMITVETVEKAMNSASCEQKGHSASDIRSWTSKLLPIGFKMLQKKIIRSVTRVLAVLFKLHPDVQPATTRGYNPEKMSIHLLHQDFLYVLEFQTGKITSIETMWESYCLSRNLYETVESMLPEQVAEQMKDLYSGSHDHIRDTLLRHCASVLVHRIMDYRNRARRDDKSFDTKKKEHEQMLDKIRKKSGTQQD